MTSCPVCGSRRSTTRLQRPDHQIVECRNCHLAWTAPESFVTQASYDTAPEVSALYATADPRRIGYARAALGRLKAAAPAGRLLDVGCSVGTLVQVAAEWGYQAEGIDLDPVAVDVGRKRGLALHCQSLESWPQDKYDVIVLQHTLEHVAQPVEFLRLCRQRLSDQGVVLVLVPGHTGLLPRLFSDWWYGWLPRQHYFHYSADALSRVARTADLTPVRVFHTMMDHWISLAGIKTAIKSTLTTCTARLGFWIGRGDQLVGVFRRHVARGIAG